MATIDRVDWVVLREISQSRDGLQSFTMYRRLSITAIQLAVTIGRLQRLRLVELEQDTDRIRATDAGFMYLQSFRRPDPSCDQSVLKDSPENSSWILREQLPINAPYVPRIDLL